MYVHRLYFDLISQKFKSEVSKMIYNKAKEEWKWRQWKEKEEEQLRACGMGEDSIQKLWKSDWEDFRAERIYQNHRADYPEYPKWETVEHAEPDSIETDALLDNISDRKIFCILKEADRWNLGCNQQDLSDIRERYPARCLPVMFSATTQFALDGWQSGERGQMRVSEKLKMKSIEVCR